MEVKILKLVSGEEILAKVTEGDSDNTVVINKPMALMLHTGQQGGIQMVPWLMLSQKEEAEIPKDKIIVMYDPKTEIVNGYQSQIGGIVTAPANALDN